MLRSTLLVHCAVLAISSQAQSWCPPGAEWLFNFYSQQATGVRRAWYSGDTLVGGLPCQRIDQTIIAYEPITPFGSTFILQDAPIITHGQGDLIRIWDQPSNEFDTLAWFGAVPGNHWTLPQFDGLAHFDVLDTGTTVVAGVPLRYLVVEEPIVMGIGDTLFERIGFNYFYVRPIESMLLDFTTTGLVCYRDEEIGQFDGGYPWHPCDFTLSVAEENILRAQPFPNPGTDQFTIILPQGPTMIVVKDALGRSVLMQQTTGGSTVIDASGLRSGTYFVRTSNSSGSPLHVKWIKQ